MKRASNQSYHYYYNESASRWLKTKLFSPLSCPSGLCRNHQTPHLLLPIATLLLPNPILGPPVHCNRFTAIPNTPRRQIPWSDTQYRPASSQSWSLSTCALVWRTNFKSVKTARWLSCTASSSPGDLALSIVCRLILVALQYY